MIGVGLLLLFLLASCLAKEADKSDDPDKSEVVNSDSTDDTDTLEVEKVIVGTMENVKGDVLVLDGNGSGIDGADGMEIAQGWAVKTGKDSSASIEFSSDMVAYVGENAHITVEETDDSTQILLTQHAGFIYHAGHHDNYLVQTDSAEVSPVGTHFMVGIDPQTGETAIFVTAGIVSARNNESSGQSDDHEGRFDIYPNQSANTFPPNDEDDPTNGPPISVIDLEQLVNDMDASIIEALLRNKNKIETENEALIQSIRNQLAEGNPPPGLSDMSENDLNNLRNNLETIIADIVNQAIQRSIMSEEEVRQIIEQINQSSPERRDLDDFLADLDARQGRGALEEQRRLEQLRAEQQRRAEQAQNQRDRQAELSAQIEQQKAERQRAEQQRAARERADAIERQRQLEAQRQLLAHRGAGPSDVILNKLSYMGNKISGNIDIGRAKDEKYMSEYILYWVNDQKDKLKKLGTVNKEKRDLTYSLGVDANIPKGATGILALAANKENESKETAYQQLSKISGNISFSKPSVGDDLKFVIRVTPKGNSDKPFVKLIDLVEGKKTYDYEILASPGKYDLEYGFVHGSMTGGDEGEIYFSKNKQITVDRNKKFDIGYEVVNMRTMGNEEIPTYIDIMGDDFHNFNDDEDGQICTFGLGPEWKNPFNCVANKNFFEQWFETFHANISDDHKYYVFYRLSDKDAFDGKIVFLTFEDIPNPE